MTHPLNIEPRVPTDISAPEVISQPSPVPGSTPGRLGGGVETTPVLRRSTRTTKNQTSKYQDYVTGSQYDREDNADSICSVSSTLGAFCSTSLFAIPLPPGQENVSYFWNGSYWEAWLY